MLDLRKQARAALAGLVGAEPEQISLTGSTTDGCNIVLAGLDLQPEDEIVTTSEEHFGLIGPVHAQRRARRGRRAGPRRDSGRGDASDAAARALPGALDERPRVARARAAGADGRAGAGRRRAVGRLDPGRRRRSRLPHDLRSEVALRPRLDRRTRGRRPGAPARRPPELFLAVRPRAVGKLRAGRRRGPVRSRVALERRPRRVARRARRPPEWASSVRQRWPRAAASCSRRWSRWCRAMRRSWPSAPRIRPRSSPAWPRRASSCARSRRPGSSASRAAGGPTRTTCSGWSRAL